MAHDTVKSDIRAEALTLPKMKLPSVANIQCTQNAGHGELSYPVEEVTSPSRGWSTDVPSMFPELQ